MLKKVLKVIAVVLCAAMIFLTGMDLYRLYMAKNADLFVRFDFTGIENMFHTKYEYYAVAGNKSAKIPKRYVPDGILNSYVGTIYDDSSSDYWYVELAKIKEDYPYKGDWYEKSTLGDGMYLMWSNWTNETHNPEEKEIEIFRSTADFLHNNNPDSWVWEDGGGNRGLKAFMLIRNSGRYLVIDEKENCLYKLDENHKLLKIMKPPRGGDFNYYWFDW